MYDPQFGHAQEGWTRVIFQSDCERLADLINPGPDCSNLNVFLLNIYRLKDDLLIVVSQSVAKFASKLTPYPMFGTQELLGKERSFQLVHSILFGMDHLSG